MSKSYLLANYLVPVFIRAGDEVGSMGFGIGPAYYRRQRIPEPKNFTIRRLDRSTLVRVTYYDWDRGLIMIRANSRRRAYEVAEVINGYFSACFGYDQDPSRMTFWLQECERVPQPSWSEKDLANALLYVQSGEEDYEIHELQIGVDLAYHHIDSLARHLPSLVSSPRLVHSLLQFRHSRQLFAGFMVGSYYDAHYQYDRREAPRWLMEKRYFEQRARYELAFVAAFKAIEAFFGGRRLARNTIDRAFEQVPFGTVTPDKIYGRRHEIFAGMREHITYRDLIIHFLDIRNAVAAHANQTPPRHFLITEDNLFEIQLFLTDLVGDAIEHLMPNANEAWVINPRQFPSLSNEA